MKSTKLELRKNGVNPKKLNPSQLLFINTLAADVGFNPVAAVRECYPKNRNPASQAAKLMANPDVQKMLGKVLRQRLERLELKADDVLEYLRFALFYNPLEHFAPTKDGRWTITNLADLPKEVGQLVDKMKLKVTENEDGSTTSFFEVELISKAVALNLAMKHIGVDKVDVTHRINWDDLPQEGQVIDVIEQRLLEENDE